MNEKLILKALFSFQLSTKCNRIRSKLSLTEFTIKLLIVSFIFQIVMCNTPGGQRPTEIGHRAKDK